MNHWLEEFVSRCRRQQDIEASSRERYLLAVHHGEDAFANLVGAIRSDIDYFRANCPDAARLLEVKTNLTTLTVWAQPPYNSKVLLFLVGDYIRYEKVAQPNPRADTRTETGKIIIKSNYEHSLWLEHKGERVEYQAVSKFLIEELFESLLER